MNGGIHSHYHADDELDDDANLLMSRRSKSENHLSDVTPPRSPKFSLEKESKKPVPNGGLMLMRPAENSPFSTTRMAAGTLSQNSTPYSQVSVPSSYEYEDDFTSDDSEDEISVRLNNVNSR